MDAHNCYPYFGWWSDRIDRALSSGTPLAIEQDLFWFTDPKTGTARSLVTHGAPSNGDEPSMREYFFERIRPLIEKALKDGTRGGWPLITLNLDLKSEEPAHLAAIWKLLTEYREWITTAPRTTDIHTVAPLDVKPILVLTGESDAQKAVFNDQVPVGSALLVFGATPTHVQIPSAPPESLAPDGADNYHRWWNNPWRVVESAGQANAGEWTPEKENRLHDLVRYAHQRGLWIRFYTLDGVSRADESCRGIFHLYNFGSRAAVEQRWHAAARAGVDYIATDQYEDLARLLRATNQSTTGALAFGADGNAAIRQLPHPES
jgi:glycerophosphoryl diester phosphodiesterase